MRTLLGMILGALLTVVFVYAYDSASTSSTTTAGARTIVNWDVAAADWQVLKTRTRESWNKLTQEAKG